MIKSFLLLLVFFVFSYFVFTYNPGVMSAPAVVATPSPAVTWYPNLAPPSADGNKLFEVVNDWKEKEDGYRYKKSDVLCEYASARVEEIKTDWSHSGFKAIDDPRGFYRLGENLSRDLDSESLILQSWLKSPSHKANLDEPFTHGCIKCHDNYCAHLFGRY